MADQPPAGKQLARVSSNRRSIIVIDRVSLVGAVVLVAMSLAILLMWFVVNFVWATGDITRHTTSPIQVASGVNLEVDYPDIILADDTAVTFTFTLQSDASLVQTTTITVETPSGTRAIISGSAPISDTANVTTTASVDARGVLDTEAPPRTLILEFGPQTKPHTKLIQLLNTRTESVWWLFQPGSQSCLTITLSGSSDHLSQPCFKVESTSDHAWRSFVDSAVDEKSPLIILVGGLLSAGLWWWNQRRAKREQQESGDRLRAAEQLREFRAAVCRQLSAKAYQALGEMQKPELLPHNSSEDLERAQMLIKLMDGELSETLINSASAIWSDETAGALVYAAKYAPKDRAGLRRAIRAFPLEKIALSELRESLKTVGEEIDARPLQARNWPLRRELRDGQLPALAGSIGERIASNPFAYEHAEEEVSLLFAKGRAFFWPLHPLYKRLMTSGVSEIAWGAPGTGKTAMGSALGEFPFDNALACYLAGLPTLSQIRTSFAWKLLTFVQYHPTFLGLLGQHERHLLSRLLVSYLGQELVLAEIHRVPDVVDDWQKEPADDAGRQLRELNLLTQLRLLEQDVNAVASKPGLPDTQWPLALAHCAQALEFKQIRLVLDSVGDECSEWLQRFVLPNLSTWAEADIVVKILVPDDVAKALQLPTNPSRMDSVTCHQLQWQNDQMQQMIEWRFEQVGTNVALADVITANLLEEIIASSHLNPRCFIQLWNAIVTLNPKDGRITADVLRQAEKQVSCP